jgi:predicted ABC-class ATPase
MQFKTEEKLIMKSFSELHTELRSIDHKSYPAYKSLTGGYQFENYQLYIDHVQGDPFASPSSLHVEILLKDAAFPTAYYKSDHTRIALQDYLTRCLASHFDTYNFKAKGSGKSGLLSISHCGQEILERSACQITGNLLIARFHVGFPAFGRTINAQELEKILFDFLPHCIKNSLFYRKLDSKKVEKAIQLAEDQQTIRDIMKKERLVAFVANGSVLPRKSGVSDLPMKDCIPFYSPASMERTFVLPHRGKIQGMAIPNGITLIVGGGYHGKSTLLEALQSGVYNHIEGDGREFVLTDDTAIKLRAEDGRSIQQVDISLFIKDLPNQKDTTSFTTSDASGSTSQAAAVIEHMEAGSKLFLIDEDTSATNFMVRDELMQQVIRREKEPITPFLERVKDLYEQTGISTILVAGSSGAFFYVADRILQMDCYRPVDITAKVKEICQCHPAPRIQAPGFTLPNYQRFLKVSENQISNNLRHRGNNPRKENSRAEHMKIKLMGSASFSINKEIVDLRYLEQLSDSEQTNALAYLLRYVLEQLPGKKVTIQQIVEHLSLLMNQKGWEPFCSSYVPCGLAKPRVQEIYACLNRFRR